MPFIIRCHRAFLVNIRMVVKVDGNSQGYKLNLEGCEEEVPVSRAYAKEVKALIETGQRVSHSSQKYVVRHKEFVGCHISGLSVPDIFCLIPFLYVCGRKHNECKDMKRETVFGILGVLLYTQPSVAQKSVTDTVRLNLI